MFVRTSLIKATEAELQPHAELACQELLSSGKPSEEKKSVSVCFFSKGGEVMSETKLFEELLCLDIFQKEGGDCLIPKFLRNFSA